MLFYEKRSLGNEFTVNKALAKIGLAGPQNRAQYSRCVRSPLGTTLVVDGRRLKLEERRQLFVPVSEPFQVDEITRTDAKARGKIIIFWDRDNSLGYFVYDDSKYSISYRASIKDAENLPVFLVIGRMCDWKDNSIPTSLHQFAQSYKTKPIWSLVKTQKYLLSTYLDRKHASQLLAMLFMQQHVQQREIFMDVFGGIIHSNPSWTSSMMLGVAALPSTIRTYMSHLRDFAQSQCISTKQLLLRIQARKVSGKAIKQWLWNRLHGKVRYSTIANAISAFSWFYVILCKETFVQVHPTSLAWLKRLRKRWSIDPVGALELKWHDMLTFLTQIKHFDWSPFTASDIFDCAVLSLWAALRTGEALDLHLNDIEFASLNGQEVTPVPPDTPGAMLHITLYNVKTATGNATVAKFVPSFEVNPEFCPHLAFRRLRKHRHGYWVDHFGQPLRSRTLSQLFRRYVDWVVPTHLPHLIAEKSKISWYSFRVSFFNIQVSEMDVPATIVSVHATHNNPNTLHTSYIQRTAPKRQFTDAALVKKKVSEYVRSFPESSF